MEQIHQESPDAIRRSIIDQELATLTSGEINLKHRSSEYGRALFAITETAVADAGKNLPLSETEEFSLRDRLSKAVDLMSELRLACGFHDGSDDQKFKLWSHRSDPIAEIMVRKTPRLSRAQIEMCVGRYLQLPDKSLVIDRLLVDLLVALEVYGFGDEMINVVSIPGILSTSPMKRRPILEWLLNAALTILGGLAVAWALSGLAQIHIWPKDWLNDAYVVLGIIAVLYIGWTTISLPRTCWLAYREKQKISGLIDQMMGVYADLRSDGPISAHHIEYRARAAADAGVVWLAPLFVLRRP